MLVEDEEQHEKEEEENVGSVVEPAASELIENDDDDGDQVRVYPSRWWMLLLYSLSTATSAILWISFASVANLTQDYYQVDAGHVNSLSIVFMAMYVPFTIVSSAVFNKFGVRQGFLWGSLFNLASGGLRYASTLTGGDRHPSFALLFISQSIGAMGQPFFTNMPARLGALWFPVQERDTAVVLAFLANIFGTAVGSALPVAFTTTISSDAANNTTIGIALSNSSTTDDDSNNDSMVLHMSDYMLCEFLLTIFIGVGVLLFFQEKPPTPPSRSESDRADGAMPHDSLSTQLRKLMTNKDFMVLVISTGCLSLGLLNSLVTILEQLIAPVGYTSSDASLFSGLCIISGILFSIVVGAIMDKTHAYNLLLKIGLVLGAVAFTLFFYALRPGQTALLAGITGFIGMTMLPILPLAMECACECTYPIHEDLSSGILMSCGQVSGIFILVTLNGLLGKEAPYDKETGYLMQPSYGIFIGGAVTAMLMGFFYNGKYLRFEADRRRSPIVQMEEQTSRYSI